MAVKMSIFSLLLLVAVVASHPFGFGIEIEGKSKLGGGGSAGGKVGAGIDGGLNGGGKGEAEVHGSWIKSILGKVYVANKDGAGIGLGGSLGSDMDAVVNGSATIRGDTAIVRSSGGVKTGLDADGHYRAGGDVHFLSRDELARSVHNARAFTSSQDENHIQTKDDEGENAPKPKYSKWLD